MVIIIKTLLIIGVVIPNNVYAQKQITTNILNDEIQSTYLAFNDTNLVFYKSDNSEKKLSYYTTFNSNVKNVFIADTNSKINCSNLFFDMKQPDGSYTSLPGTYVEPIYEGVVQ
jgi:hypothetical protein